MGDPFTGQQSGSRTYPVGYTYDYAGRMQTMTTWTSYGNPATAEVTTWYYDSQRGWLRGKAYADGHGPSYTYTPAGRLQSRIWVRLDGGGHPVTTTYGYDLTGGLTNIVYSDGTPSVTNSYDRLGRMTGQATASYRLASVYDLANNVFSEAYIGGPLNGLCVSNRYDSLLRRTNVAMVSGGSTVLAGTAYGYDAASRLQMVSDGTGDSAVYSYVVNSALVGQITYKQNGTTAMTTAKQYDYLNRLTQVSSQPGGAGAPAVSFNYGYNNANQRTQDRLADGSYWMYGYDSLGQVISGHKYFSDGTVVPGQQFDYSFDTIGNRTQTKAGGDQTGGNQRIANYAANDLNQTISRDYPGTNDVVGVALATNAVTINGQPAWRKGEYFWGTVATNNASSAQWQQVAVASGGNASGGGLYVAQTPEQFRYDADGNLTNDGRWTYTWDAENRLIAMATNTLVGPPYQLAFVYDPKGRRVEKTVVTNGVSATTLFLYDGWNLAGVLSSPSTVLESFMWGTDLSGSMQGAGGVSGLLGVSYRGSVTTNCFVAFDGNGNAAALVNAANGSTVAAYEYGPFGEVIRSTMPMAKANPFRFSTKYQDDESDLLYYGYRYYKASTGTWVSKDPKDELGFTLLRFGKIKTNSQISKHQRCLLCDNVDDKASLNPVTEGNIYGFVGDDPIQNWDYLGLKESNAEKIVDIALEMADAAIDGSESAEGIGDITALLKLCNPCFTLNLAAGILDKKFNKCITDNPPDFTKPPTTGPCARYEKALTTVNGLRDKNECK